MILLDTYFEWSDQLKDITEKDKFYLDTCDSLVDNLEGQILLIDKVINQISSRYYKLHCIILDTLKAVQHILCEIVFFSQTSPEVIYDNHQFHLDINDWFQDTIQIKLRTDIVEKFPLAEENPDSFIDSFIGLETTLKYHVYRPPDIIVMANPHHVETQIIQGHYIGYNR